MAWNVERKRPTTPTGAAAVRRIAREVPEIVVLTEARVGHLDSLGGHEMTSQPPPSERHAPDERKVLAWSRNRVPTTVGRFDAFRADIELGEIDCGAAGSCAFLGTNHGAYTKGLLPGSTYRVWVIEQGSQDPLALIAAYRGPTQRDWFDTAGEVVATITFDQVGPNPVTVMGPGRVELPLLGGAAVELEEPTVLFEDGRGSYRSPIDGQLAGIDFLVDVHDRTGARPESIDALVDDLETWGVEVTERAPVVVDEIAARVFDIASAAALAELEIGPDAVTGWFVPSAARFWVMEHPERGLMVISAGVGPEAAGRLDEVVERTEAIVRSIRFTDPN